ncbi:MAG: GNAT family N-acetyltransferase [Verrucomicrobiota bacterium]
MIKLVHWAQFSWDLSKNPPVCPALPPSFSIRRATAEDHSTVRSVVLSSFTLDSDWNPFFGEIRPLIEAAISEVFHEKSEPFCLVISHGPRIIGASGLGGERDARRHLLTGPCLSLEYHNRGLGTVLLGQSLLALRDAGVSTVRGVTKQGSAAAQFLYPKFGSVRLEEKRKQSV